MTSLQPSSNVFVRILDRTGKPLYASPDFNTLQVPSDSVTQPLKKGLPWRGTILSSQGQSVRLYSTMLIDQSSVVGVVQVGESLTQLNTRLQNIVYDLLLVTPLVLILSALGSSWLAARAFRSIHQLAYTAREIGAKDLDQRVPVPEARDEVQELALIFNQMIGRLEKAFAQQRRFVADASHELRTPVAAIRSMTEVALSQLTESEDYVNVLREVNAEAERLGRLTNDLLALARADEGQVQFDSDAVRLDLLAADAVESLEPLANERNITLSTETLQPATVRGDAARLIQVIIGLVDNALTYTNAGGFVKVSVEVQGTTAQLIVHDTGIGIAQEDLGHIFERFYRADPARSRSAGGCGLGLAIVDWVVRAHNGTVTVESQVGKGSTFTVTLPLEKDS
jgi:heavy metal sensor kinase